MIGKVLKVRGDAQLINKDPPEMLKGSDETYWIDEASRPSLSTENNYGTPRKRQLCVTISMRNNLIQRVDRECSEKHSFICQIGQNDFD